MFFSMTFLKIYEVNFLEPSSWSVRIRWWDEKGRQVSRRNIFILIKISSRNLASLFYFIYIFKCVWPLSRYLDKQIINDFENLSFHERWFSHHLRRPIRSDKLTFVFRYPKAKDAFGIGHTKDNSVHDSHSLERRWSSRTFRYGYLVTTSPQL